MRLRVRQRARGDPRALAYQAFCAAKQTLKGLKTLPLALSWFPPHGSVSLRKHSLWRPGSLHFFFSLSLSLSRSLYLSQRSLTCRLLELRRRTISSNIKSFCLFYIHAGQRLSLFQSFGRARAKLCKHCPKLGCCYGT